MRDMRRLKAGIWPAAAACIISAGLLWGALADRKSGMPDGWVPVNDRVEASLANLAGEQEDAKMVTAVTASGEQKDGGEGLDAEDVEREGTVDDTAGEDGIGDRADAKNAGGTVGGADADVGKGAEAADSGKLDLNAATASELDALPGIGPAKAQAIIEDRQANGPYESVEQLTRVKGIGTKLLDKLKPYVRAGG